MQFGKHDIEKVYRFDVDFENKEYALLKDYGLKEIQNDSEALVNYAVNKILANAVKLEKTVVKEMLKKVKSVRFKGVRKSG